LILESTAFKEAADLFHLPYASLKKPGYAGEEAAQAFSYASHLFT